MAKLNTNSNAYIIIYSAILVVIVAFLLAFIYKALKPMQDRNVELDIEKQILYSLNIRNLDGTEAHAKYLQVVKEIFPYQDRNYYKCDVDGKDIVVVELKGMGLWGGIGGYIAIERPSNTVYGAYFNHESETAGLGAEIKDSQAWQEKFIGKKLYKDGSSDVALSVVKKVEDPETQVDCVTGATLTSNGVNDMIKACLEYFPEELKTTDCCQAKKADCCAEKNADCCAEKKADCCAEKNADCCAEKKADCCAEKKADCCAEKKADCCAEKKADCCAAKTAATKE